MIDSAVFDAQFLAAPELTLRSSVTQLWLRIVLAVSETYPFAFGRLEL